MADPRFNKFGFPSDWSRRYSSPATYRTGYNDTPATIHGVPVPKPPAASDNEMLEAGFVYPENSRARWDFIHREKRARIDWRRKWVVVIRGQEKSYPHTTTAAELKARTIEFIEFMYFAPKAFIAHNMGEDGLTNRAEFPNRAELDKWMSNQESSVHVRCVQTGVEITFSKNTQGEWKATSRKQPPALA